MLSPVPLEDRTCELCNLNVCEDEVHFLCICPLYQQSRQRFFDHIRTFEPNFNLMGNSEKCILNKNHQTKLAKFIALIWETRKNYLFNIRLQ